jgi:hypothetical protein
MLSAKISPALSLEKKGVAVRQSLRRFGDLIRIADAAHSKK